MLDSLQSFVSGLLGKREDDPQATITADQLYIVLKSIEDKYIQLKDENGRLHERIAQQQQLIAKLEGALAERSAAAEP